MVCGRIVGRIIRFGLLMVDRLRLVVVILVMSILVWLRIVILVILILFLRDWWLIRRS